MISKRSFLVIGLVVVGALVVWRLLPRRVSVVAPVRGPAVQAVYATGTVEPTVMLPIAPRTSARIEELKVDEGARVKAGELLARLEDAEQRANLHELTTQEVLAKQEFDRVSRLIERRAVSQDEFDKAQSRLQAARAVRKAAEARVGYLTLVAPSNGVVIRRDGEVGELVAVNKAVYWLSGDAPLRVSAEVDEEDIPQIQAGQHVLIRADAFPGQVFDGKVESITPKGDPVARSFRVRISFGSDAPLRIGMTAENNIIISESKDALLVPTSAVVGNAVWVLADGRITRRAVEIGARGTEQTEVRKGLSEKDLVLVGVSSDLREGMRARGVLRG